MSTHSEQEPSQEVRWITDTVGLFVEGERPRLKTGAEILDVARATEFAETGRIVERVNEAGRTIDVIERVDEAGPVVERAPYEAGRTEYVPRTLVQDPIAMALSRGLLVYKFTIEGTPPEELSALAPGTYYTFVDFLESPDPLEQGRWIARTVNEGGEVECEEMGVSFRQGVRFHGGELTEEHSRPGIVMHGHAPPEEAESVRLAAGDWMKVKVKWTPITEDGIVTGCVEETACVKKR